MKVVCIESCDFPYIQLSVCRMKFETREKATKVGELINLSPDKIGLNENISDESESPIASSTLIKNVIS